MISIDFAFVLFILGWAANVFVVAWMIRHHGVSGMQYPVILLSIVTYLPEIVLYGVYLKWSEKRSKKG
jgi:hypothetical protein